MTTTAKTARNSSTVSPRLRRGVGGREDFFARLLRIDARREAANISLEQLAAAAKVSRRAYQYNLAGRFAPRASALRRLDAALDLLIRDVAETHLCALWRSTLSLVALDMGLVPADVLAAAPQANLKGDENWMAAAQARHRAFYLLVTAHNVPMTQAAAVAGVSKQAVSKALRRVEDGREDPLRDRAIEMLAQALEVPA
ncbi:helix-turn-helix domain-containing protein [Ancylobacter sp. A5.8]|uniref:helix-turn-helix domain-containing protein n=1 Tax=Ancylobacter gelatini TaxID=2919920 RepID=UPI001F4E817B|nr:helix-turn-helix domain-containing protein [Ancylobacter gelatini]MCJ8143828.1 helix-turn-helix domain-containing protein [Ancylobacter gelatini]